MTRRALLRKMNPRERPGTAVQSDADRGLLIGASRGETLGGVARLKEGTSGVRT